MAAQYQFTVQRVSPDVSLSFSIDGQDNIFSSGSLVYSLSLVNVSTTYLFAGEISFVNSNDFEISLSHDGNSFVFSCYKDRNNPSLDFTPSSSIGCYFYYDDYTIDNNYDDGSGGSSVGGFSVPSLNGNCGSLPDGSIVTVTGLSGEFNVVASQFVWNDSTAQMSMIMYNLSKDGNFCLVPDVYVTAKAS